MARDGRLWVPVDVGLPTNRKLYDLDARSKWLYMTSLCWCKQQLNDGVFRLELVLPIAKVPAKYAQPLVDNWLWHDKIVNCPDCAQPTGTGEYVIHHFTQHNPSAAHVRRVQRARAEAGNAGNHKRWKHPGEYDECAICHD